MIARVKDQVGSLINNRISAGLTSDQDIPLPLVLYSFNDSDQSIDLSGQIQWSTKEFTLTTFAITNATLQEIMAALQTALHNYKSNGYLFYYKSQITVTESDNYASEMVFGFQDLN